MKLLLALLCIRSAQGFDFVQFAGNGQESGVLYATGFCIEVIDTVWQKYSRRLIHAAATDLEFEAGFGPLRGDPDKLEFEVALSLHAGLRYVHQYPTAGCPPGRRTTTCRRSTGSTEAKKNQKRQNRVLRGRI